MNIPVDIHTHRLPQVPGTAIVNGYPETFSPQSGGWYSVGIHPWHIGRSGGEHSGAEGTVAGRVCGLEELVRHPQVLAVGEAGLDKLADAPMDLQVEVFRRQACLAEEVGKPLVIHLVKAVDELLKVKWDLRPSNPWIIHGFRGKAALAEEYLKHGFYLSFGEKYQEAALCRVPADRLFIVTDIQGLEDFFGDMDFKVAGTKDGITAIQMDIKIHGLTRPIVEEAIRRTREARMYILNEVMLPAIGAPREKVGTYAPKIVQIQIDPQKIGDVVGQRGKTINTLIERTGVKIDITDDGSVSVCGEDEAMMQEAIRLIQIITTDYYEGQILEGDVVSIKEFGVLILCYYSP